MSAKNNLSVAEKTAKLDKLVAWFNSDNFELERALDKFTKAEQLAAEIESDLLALKNRIEIVKAKFERTD